MKTNRPKTILLVDDEPNIIELYGALLAKAGFTIISATNGPDAIKLAAARRPDLILLDFSMPGMNGAEVVAKLKANPETKDIAVVFISAVGDPNFTDADVQAAQNLGSTDFIRKGMTNEEFVAKVKTYL